MRLVTAFSIARGISEFGNALRIFAIPIAIFGITKNKVLLSNVQIILTLGAVLGSIITGAIIDRSSKVFSLVFADLTSLFFTIIIGLGIFYGQLALIFSGVFFVSFIASFHSSALDAATTDFLEKDGSNVFRGFSFQHLLIIFFSITGGYSAALLSDKIPLWTFLAIDGLTFFFSSSWILYLVKTHHRETYKNIISKKSFFSGLYTDWKEGFLVAVSNSDAIKHILAQSILSICFGLMIGAMDVHLLFTLKWTPEIFGFFGPTNKISYLLGGISTFTFSKSSTLKRLCYAGSILIVLGYTGLLFSKSIFFLFLFFGIQQIGSSFINSSNKTLVMVNINSEARGRVAAFRKLTIDIGLFLGNILAIFFVKYGTNMPLAILAVLSAIVPFLLLRVRNWPE
jgi:MFS family permease